MTMSDNADDEARRRNEINMFAAFALGEAASTAGNDDDDSIGGANNATATTTSASATGFNSNAFDSGSVRISPPPAQNDEISAFSAAALGGEQASFQQMISQANNSDFQIDSGTFAMTPSSKADGGMGGDSSNNNNGNVQIRRSDMANLEAAAAALAIGDDEDNQDKNNNFLSNPSHFDTTRPSLARKMADEPKFRKMEPTIPMYSEEVRLPRPLFFGPVVPPRVLKEARRIVKDALEEKGYDASNFDLETGEIQNDSNSESTNNPPKLSSLPPEVQNIVGALRVYGFGLPVFPFDETNTKREMNKPFWKGNAYVSTYQPVFGETARRLRHKNETEEKEPQPQQQEEEQAQQPSQQHSSSETGAAPGPIHRTCKYLKNNEAAPMTDTEKANASFLANINADMDQENTQSKDAVAPAAVTPTPAESESPPAEPTNNEISLFSMWARGEGEGDGIGSSDNGKDNAGQMNRFNDSFGSITMSKPGKNEEDKQLHLANESQTIRDKASSNNSKPTSNKRDSDKPPPLSQDVFSQWARGASERNINSGTFAATTGMNDSDKTNNSNNHNSSSQFDFQHDAAGTFQIVPNSNINGDDSDDDSIVGSELKKKVGVNEHLDAALASLVDDGPSTDVDGDESEHSRNMLQMMRTTPGGRPLSNLELTNGCVPLFGIDDSPLPVEGDLGIHETKVDEQRTFEQNKSQEIIDKYACPNIFGPVACPSPSTSPDDNHSWNSRSAPSQRYNSGAAAGAPGATQHDRVSVLPVPNEPSSSPKPPTGRTSSKQSSPRLPARVKNASSASAASNLTPASSRKSSRSGGGPASAAKRGPVSRYGNRHRYGWWSISEDPAENDKGGGMPSGLERSVRANEKPSTTPSAVPNDRAQAAEDPLQLPPNYHPSLNLHLDTQLQPCPEMLRDENLSLSDLHSATSMAHALPYLSDRPPSYRYLQIDTQAVGFPPLGGEIEPLFCSLAIYNVETSSGAANDSSAAPMPDMQRCGRVTEVLNFDVVSDQAVEDSCIGSLWPFYASSTMTPHRRDAQTCSDAVNGPSSASLQGTRCGVFPLPSSLNVANLYAVLIVQKVLSEDSDFEIYIKQKSSSRSSSSSSSPGAVDINKFRARAEKASNQHGSFLMPFAFGVAPLLQVFGADNPIVASSRAVQIPLFRFAAGLGERQIIDHIMVMLYPRADFRANGIGGPAAVTNGGTAMLVMRNFGYLGLHAVVHSRSSLARDRLVDFTGELQIRRRNESDPTESSVKAEGHIYAVTEWHSQFVAEPALNGGRNVVDPFVGSTAASKLENFDDSPSRSALYAQELAPIPISPQPFSPNTRQMPNSGISARARTPLNRGDIEPFYHTSFCNEMLCQPRLLHNCPKGNIVMKVELREMEWKQEHNAFVAHLPRQGPSVHNNRRGPFLIQGTYTSVSVKTADPRFLDEVKIKLPLELKPKKIGETPKTLSLFFSVYHVKFSSKKKWPKLPLKKVSSKQRDSSVSGVNDVNEATGERKMPGEESELSGKCKLVMLSCGFLPVTSQACLIENNLHEVKMMYKARPPSAKMRENGISGSSLIITERIESAPLKESQASSGFEPREESSVAGSSRTQSEAEILGSDEAASVYSDGFPTVEDRLKSDTMSTDSLSQPDSMHKSRNPQDQMLLQVRIVVHSSIHAQSGALCEFLQSETDLPTGSSGSDTDAKQILGLSRAELLREIDSGIPSSLRHALPYEERLLASVVCVAKPQYCATSEVVKHFLRVITKTMRTLVCGTGEMNLAWANPASIMPLRVHSFGSMLQLLGNASLFLSKNGVTQVDGTSKFDLMTLGRVVSLFFDEKLLFGQIDEVVSDTDLLVKAVPKKTAQKLEAEKSTESTVETKQKENGESSKPKRRRGHKRSDFELNQYASVDMSDPTSAFGDLMFGSSSQKSSLCTGTSGTSNESLTPSSSSVPLSLEDKPESAPTIKEISVSPALGIDTVTVPDLDFASLPSTNSSKQNFKVDSMSDFRSNMEKGLREEESSDFHDRPLSKGNVSSIMKTFGGMSAVGKNRWMTAPAPQLATISEHEENDETEKSEDLFSLPQRSFSGEEDKLETDMALVKKQSVRQMRIPRIAGRSNQDRATSTDISDIADRIVGSSDRPKYATISATTAESLKKSPFVSALPKTEEDIFAAGSAFLDQIGQNFGLNDGGLSNLSGDSGRHRKTNSLHQRTRSRCSHDFINLADEPSENLVISQVTKATESDMDNTVAAAAAENDFNDDTMSTLRLEDENCILLPSFVDRLAALGKGNEKGRWFPYTYEVVIMIWTAFLTQQRSYGEKAAGQNGTVRMLFEAAAGDAEANLAEAASNAHRVAIACAPLLFEIIKQSLRYRVEVLVNLAKGNGSKGGTCPPLVILDETLQQSLEKIISMVADACLDSRNFDSRDVRQMIIDVNDSMIRFLRDMFSFLRPSDAYRLIMVYLSRFVTKEGKQWQDRDSSIGLRCSWEITKLRLNSMSCLIRFPDFLRVCSPQMNNWSTWKGGLTTEQDKFFDGVLARYKQLELFEFTTDGAFQNSGVEIPPMQPHWLAEVATEVLLAGTEHAEQYIQQRASSLLHELFWANSQHSMANGTTPVIASMYITFIEKVLLRTSYLSNFAAKSQLRKDIIPCVLFVLQGTPGSLLRAQWRQLCYRSQGKGGIDRFGGIGVSMFVEPEIQHAQDPSLRNSASLKNEPDILDMFTLLNMSLSTFEYEGCEDLLESESGGGDNEDQIMVWHKEYLLAQGHENQQPFMGKRQGYQRGNRLDTASQGKGEKDEKHYFSSSSRKWQSHDGSLVVINCVQQIVAELAALLQSAEEGTHHSSSRRSSVRALDIFGNPHGKKKGRISFSSQDTVIFLRAATSVYLHSLALRQSDIVLVRTFKHAAELVKVFGVKMFLEAVGETLQHWMRVVSLHCGARRAKVRIEATDFLERILKGTWESYGSFFRIRIPLLAVQTEVMERIVAVAASRYFREERRKGTTLDNFSNASAEASLAPLWRTLDRLHHLPASQNVAFRGGLMRLAEKLKKLYRAYIAARALSYLKSMRALKKSEETKEKAKGFSETDALVRAYRITVLRVINASAGYSKQFLGVSLGTSLSKDSVAHYEAVMDAFLDAADVFSPTELPEHRVAWLQMLADFHSQREKFAEEATCHFQIHATLKQASALHGSLWSNTPFLPWTNNPPDPVHLEAQTGNPLDCTSDFDFDDAADGPFSRQGDDGSSSRRIFYRVANSVRANTEDWETGLSKTLFSGATFAAEYSSVSSWITLREMEEKMVEEAERAGELFLEAGIIESSRFAWNLATQYYAEKFNYGKLAHAYSRLARTVVSQVPPIDAFQQGEVSISMGRFYRVWFHGGAPDELIGAEFVYRTASWVRLDQFGEQLKEVIKCIIPDRTPIHLALDGQREESSQRNYGGFSRLGPAPLEPVKIKVTPLRPLFAKGNKVRGLPEWFHRYIDEAMARAPTRRSNKRQRGGPRVEDVGRFRPPGHRGNNLSFTSSASVFASTGSSASGSMLTRRSSLSKVADGNRGSNSSSGSSDSDLVGVDKFGFLQPVHHKDRLRGSKDWWRPASGDFAQKSLKVTQLQVGQSFPACVTRQAVVHRVVFTQSPLEAGVDSVCQWCSVLFRTAVATNGITVLGKNKDPGIGTEAAKVVADCIHSSRVKEMGLSLLKMNGNVAEEENTDIFHSSDRLMDDEVKKLQQKLARIIVVFLELLHLLVSRNRDLLLNVIQDRKKDSALVPPPPERGMVRHSTTAMAKHTSPNPRSLMRPGSFDGSDDNRERLSRAVSDEVHRPRHGDDIRTRSNPDDSSYSGASLGGGAGNVRTDSAIAVQSELQRAFISLTKSLYPGIHGIMQSDTPRWLKQCTQENYFSLGTYRQTRIPISEELCFSSANESFNPSAGGKDEQPGLPGFGAASFSNHLSAESLVERNTESPSASVTSSSVYSRHSGGSLRYKSEI